MQCTGSKAFTYAEDFSYDGIQDVPATLSMFYKNELEGLQLFVPSTEEKPRTWHLCYKAIYITFII